MKISDKTIKALKIITKNSCRTARDFAEKMWPDNLMHTRVSNQGNGACHGKGAWLCGGSYLGKLRQAGLVYRTLNYVGEFHLTTEGYEVLKNEETNFKNISRK